MERNRFWIKFCEVMTTIMLICGLITIVIISILIFNDNIAAILGCMTCGTIGLLVTYGFLKLSILNSKNIYYLRYKNNCTIYNREEKENELQDDLLNGGEISDSLLDTDVVENENQAEKYECPNCFAKISPIDKVCSNCGFKFKSN